MQQIEQPGGQGTLGPVKGNEVDRGHLLIAQRNGFADHPLLGHELVQAGADELAAEVDTPTLCRKTMTSLIAFCSCHAAATILVRLGPTPGHLDEALHLLIDDPQDVGAKMFHHPLSHDRADALDQPGSQITLNPLNGRAAACRPQPGV